MTFPTLKQLTEPVISYYIVYACTFSPPQIPVSTETNIMTARHFPDVVPNPAAPVEPHPAPLPPQQPNAAEPLPVHTHLFMTAEVVEIRVPDDI